MKKSLIVLSVLATGLTAVAQTQQVGEDSSSLGSFSRPTQTISNLPWATGKALEEVQLDPILSSTAPTLTVLMASHRDTELNKKLEAAFDDATAFVATDGQVRGAYLESALKSLRNLGATRSDMQLANEIVVVNHAARVQMAK